jgi:hypothetical protein
MAARAAAVHASDGMKGRLFNYIATGSLLLCMASAWVWYLALRSYVSEGDRIEQQGQEIAQGINREPWNSPAYHRYVKEYDAWTKVRNDYRRREPQVRAAFHWRYIVLPRALIIALAVAPILWLVVLWRRYERRWAGRAFDPLTRGQRIRRVLFTTAAAASFILSLAIAACWVRSYHVTDSFNFHSFFDEGDRTFWRQTVWQSGRGSVGVNGIIQSGQRGVLRRDIENAYVQNWGMSLSAVPLHWANPPREIDFGFGPDQRKWGFVWGYFEHGRTASRPAHYGYEFIAPFWTLQVVSLALPLLWSCRMTRRRRLIRSGHCRCGYNLTGNTSGICPECGTAVPR